MRLPFFPIPSPGETVYSLTGRFLERSGLPQRALNELIVGKRSWRPFQSELTTYIDKLPPIMPIGHPWTDCRLIVRRHTILPYFTYFDSLNQSLSWESRFTEYAQTNTSKRRRSSWFANTCRYPRFCPSCVKDDNSSLGFSYFRREHQLPGVAVCWQHGDILMHGCSVCGAYQFNKQAFKMPGACFCKSGITSLPAFKFPIYYYENLKWLAEQSAHAISSSRPRVSNFFSALRVLAIKKGYRDGSQDTKIALAEAMQERFGRDLLDWLGVRTINHNEPADWIKWFLLRNPTREKNRNTLPYILLTGSMFSSIKEFEHEALVLMEKEKVYFANNEESIRPGTDDDKVRQHRSIFLDFIEKNPEANLEQVLAEIKTSREFLLRNDPDWPPLMKIMPEVILKKSPRTHRFSRSQLDIEKAAELEKFFDDIHAKNGIPIRVSKFMAISSLRLQHHYRNDSKLFVNINEVLNRRLESDDDFAKRKIRWAISELVQNDAMFSMTTVMAKARISSTQRPNYESYIHEQAKAFGTSKIRAVNNHASACQMQLF